RRWAGWGPPAAAGGAQPEGGQAGQVDRGGQQSEVLGDPDPATHAGAAAAVGSSGEEGQLALDLGSGGPVVGQPGGVALAGTGDGQVGLLGVDGDHPTTRAGGAGLAERGGGASGAR